MTIHGVTFHLTGLEDTKFVHHLHIGAVDETGVQVGGHGVDRDPGAQFALLLDSVAGTDEIQASPAEEFVERIGIRNVDRPASVMTLIGSDVAASGFRVGLGIWIRSVCNTVVNFRSFLIFTFTFYFLFAIKYFNFWL